jgi:DHA2 family multidrug resistance protein-like MFS transporter
MVTAAEGAAPPRGSPADASLGYRGNDKLLFGIILGVLGFWLFAQTTLNVAPDMQKELGVSAGLMNIAVALTALFSGIFIVVVGGLADRVGRVRIVMVGFVLSVVGSLLIGFAPAGALAAFFLLPGRALQGLSGACIMPASLALVKAYWDGEARQRAISMWSIGSWGGSGFCSLFGGFVAQNFGWRWIFFASVAVALLGMVLVTGTPESKAEDQASAKFDIAGVAAFMTAMIALQIVVTQGNSLGWASPVVLSLAAVALVVGALFIGIESRVPSAFVDFKLFRNRTYTGATISNFLLNGAAGTLLVSLRLVQLGGNMTAQQAGMLTLGYAIAIVAFIRVGEKLLRRFGPRLPMIWGCLITGFSIVLLLPSNLTLAQYRLFAIIGYTLYGIGLGFYATPSTDAALSGLPAAQVGSGAGIYKMASSLGAAFGVAISAAIFSALSANRTAVHWVEGVVTFQGRQDNLAVRQAAMTALAFNVFMVLIAVLAIMMTVPKGKKGA